MADAVFVYVTTGDRASARELGRSVVAERLAACANIIDGRESIYWWRGSLERSQETVLILKTRRSLLEALTSRIVENHDYDCPCVVAMPIVGGNPGYLDWIEAETGAA